MNNRNKVYETGSGFVTPNGDNKFFRGRGHKKDRNIDTWEDKRQDAILKILEEKARKQNNENRNS